MNPEDRLSQMLNKARGEDRVTESNWNDFATSARSSVKTQRIVMGAVAISLLLVASIGAFAALRDTGSGGDLQQPAGPTGTESESADAAPTVAPSLDSSVLNPAPDKISRPVEVWLVDPESEKLSWGYTIVEVQPDALLQEVILTLLEAPSSADIEAGLETALAKDTELLGVDLVDGVASIDLKNFEDRDQILWRMRIAQIVFQATQLQGVDQVEVLEEGQPVGLTPLSREDLDDWAPPILVNEPRIATEHESPIQLSGTANVFEATVSYELVIEEKGRDVIFESFTTATCGSGCRGEYSDEIPFEVDEPANATLNVYEVSAEDGSRLNEISLPLRLLPSD